jgi:hypothetical protein
VDGPGHPLRHNRPSFPERERQSDDLIKNQRSSLVPLSAFRYSRRSTLTQFTLFFLLEANVIRQILVVYHERAVVYSLVASWSCTRLLNVTRFSLCVCVFLLQVPEGAADPSQSLLLHGLRTPQCGDCRLPLGQVRIYSELLIFRTLSFNSTLFVIGSAESLHARAKTSCKYPGSGVRPRRRWSPSICLVRSNFSDPLLVKSEFKIT